MPTEDPSRSPPERAAPKPSWARAGWVIAGLGLCSAGLLLVLVRRELRPVLDRPIVIPARPATEIPALTITVGADGAYSIDGRIASLAEVRKNLVRPDGTPRPAALIVSPPRPDFQAAVRLLDAVRAAGVPQVSVEARAEGRTEPK